MSGAEQSSTATVPMHYTVLPRNMVEDHLRPRGIEDPRVLKAMLCVPREEFVPDDLRSSAYEDVPLPIGHGQTVAQPYVNALMAQALELQGHEKILEVGTGSGYGSAILSQLARVVYTVERLQELAAQACSRLEGLNYANVEVRLGDGSLGLPDEAPYDGIVVTAGAPALPLGYLDQLREGGRLIVPLGDHFSQMLYVFTRKRKRLSIRVLGEVAFVPLLGRSGWHRGPLDR